MEENGQMFLHIGYGNIVQLSKINAICNPESAPIKRMIAEAKNQGTCVDCTMGKKTQAVIFLENKTLILSPVQPKTLGTRADKSITHRLSPDGD